MGCRDRAWAFAEAASRAAKPEHGAGCCDDRLRHQPRPRSASRASGCGGCASGARADKRIGGSAGARAARSGVTIERVDRAVLDRAARGGVHQGVVADARRAARLRGRRPRLPGAGGAPLVVVLDGIEDPHNVGAILRTADAAGVNGVMRQSPARGAARRRRRQGVRRRAGARAHRHRGQHRARRRGAEGGQRLDGRAGGRGAGALHRGGLDAADGARAGGGGHRAAASGA